jgi:hypothetical protein
MNRQKAISTGLCAIVVLSLLFAPSAARANNGMHDRPIRLVATAWVGPIGAIATELFGKGALTINGRAAAANQPIWAGDLLQSHADISVPVVLESIGSVTLAKGTVVRLGITRTTNQDDRRPVELIASLVQGEIAVRLYPGARARVRAGGSAFESSEGAAFNARFREGRSSVSVKSGEVRIDEEQSSQQHEYTIRPVGHDSTIRVPASGTRQIQLQVMEDNLPVPGVAVLFVLDISGAISGKLGVGTLSNTTLSVVTNANGIAAVQFVAGPSSGTIPVSATIEGTRTSWTGQITVTSKGISRGTAWTIVALAGAGAAAGIIYALTRDKDDLQAQPPVLGQP